MGSPTSSTLPERRRLVFCFLARRKIQEHEVSWEFVLTVALVWGTVDLSLVLAFHHRRQQEDARKREVAGVDRSAQALT